MINSLQDLLLALNNAWLKEPLRSREDTKVRVYLDGRYVIEDVRLSKDDGAIVMWLDERGDLDEA